MEKGEPTFVPEWLKSSGSVTSAVSTNHHQIASSSLLSDDRVTLKSTRNKSSIDISSHNSGSSPVSDRTTSSYFRRNSTSNGSHLRSYGSLGRTNRDKGWDKDVNEYRDNDKSRLGDHRHTNFSDPLESNFSNRFVKDGLKRTQSSISGKYNEPWSRKVSADINSSNKINFNNGSTHLGGSSAISSVRKATFDRDFPSLGADERQIDYDLRRVPSPGLSSNMQSLPIGYSAVTNEVGWTSALAEVPVKIGANSTNKSSVAQAALLRSDSGASNMTSGLNMAETLAQGPPHVQATPQFSVGTQRLEEIAIKQSKQLIPVTPSMPKALVLSSSEKSKTKLVQQQQHQTSSTLFNHSPRGTLVKSDMPKTSSIGKLQVLKPARERNGISYPTKDSLSPPNASKVLNNPPTAAPSAGVAPPLRSPVKNPIAVSAVVPSVLEKKPSAQLRSRNDFFNLVRKKSLTNSSSSVTDSVSIVSKSVLEQCSEIEAATPLPPVKATQSDMVQSEMNGLISNRDACDRPKKSHDNGETRLSSDVILCSEEEEAAFLRSLGWDENAGEDEGLTEEEIREFYRDASKYIKPPPSSKTSL
ncbi:mediator of RNA polymerase II transcription subunit 1-like [Heracleum sosnowskyi]|uniref:Mediator of RNA polymerase II transcription subunit 1-like n=1 Tax=Heracleum sosnowskyi TaxID=360622 RepID=A0AAD8IJ24_9APIA|nr:mediator of RNA polymerase II transcription subunit 1-like [Heracleum sosnowskyi]